jgi:hypothetical protein
MRDFGIILSSIFGGLAQKSQSELIDQAQMSVMVGDV